MGLEMSSLNSAAALPDVIVVLTTQWRASAFGFAGDPNAATPYLDALARDGIWLSQTVTPHPFGVFARAAFLTGRRCPTNGIRDYYDPLPVDARTLAHAFSDAGYETAFFGKWQLFERDPAVPVVGEEHARIVVPEERRGGFDFWEGFESGFLLNDPLLHGTAIEEPTRFEGYQSDVIMERFEAFRSGRSADAAPLFAVVSLDAPHPPYAAPAAGIEPLEESAIRLIEGTGKSEAVRSAARRELAGYYAHITATDRAIGRLVESLKVGGNWENTLFAFTSAHGDMHGVDGNFRKGWPHEESIRVPMLLSWGDRLKTGRNDELLFSLLDLGPSLLGLATGASAVDMAQNGFHGLDLSICMKDGATGPVQQVVSMPSVAPFAKQCPYAWSAHRDKAKTEVIPEVGDRFTLNHKGEKAFVLA